MTSDGPRAEPAWPGPGPAVPADGGNSPAIDQAFDSDSLYALREAMSAHAAQAGLSDGRVVDLVLAVHELASNAVRHGAGHGRLRVWNTGDALRCEVTDDGVAETRNADGRDLASGDASPWAVEQGHGLWLIRQVADQASLDTGPPGTVATVSFALRPPGSLPFGLAEHSARGCAVVAVTGQLDLSSADRFTAAAGDLIGRIPGLRLILDLAGLTLWDSAGLAALLAVQGRISGDPAAAMVLAGLPGHLAARLHDAGLADRFTLAGSTDEAVGMLAPSAGPAAPRRRTPAS